MAISNAAQRSHDQLFPDHVSTLARTDPELIEYFDNFAFDEVLRHGTLDTRTRLMVQLASMIACQAVREYRGMLAAALTIGVTPVEAKEIVYQAVPYVGMAKVFDFLHTTNDALTERGVELPVRRRIPTTTSESRVRGEGAQARLLRAWPARAAGREPAQAPNAGLLHPMPSWGWPRRERVAPHAAERCSTAAR